MEKQIPKYIQRLLERRRRLAWDLVGVCSQIDEYCEKIGVLNDDTACMYGHVAIYCEPDVAQRATERAILDTLNKKEVGA